MKHRLTKLGKAALIVGVISMLLLFIMNTEVHLHPFSIHIHKVEKLMEVFIQVCAFLFFDFHGRWEGFKEGSMFILDLIKRESKKHESEIEKEDLHDGKGKETERNPRGNAQADGGKV